MTKIIRVALCAVAVIVAAPAVAEQNAAIVSIADVDPDNSGDMAKLERRLSAAVEKVCGSYARASVSEEYEIKACRRGARAGIDRQLASLRTARAERLAQR